MFPLFKKAPCREFTYAAIVSTNIDLLHQEVLLLLGDPESTVQNQTKRSVYSFLNVLVRHRKDKWDTEGSFELWAGRLLHVVKTSWLVITFIHFQIICFQTRPLVAQFSFLSAPLCVPQTYLIFSPFQNKQHLVELDEAGTKEKTLIHFFDDSFVWNKIIHSHSKLFWILCCWHYVSIVVFFFLIFEKLNNAIWWGK